MTHIRTYLWLLSMVGTALVVAPSASAHEKPSEKEVWAFRTHLRPTIDGVLDDEDWKRATPATGFISSIGALAVGKDGPLGQQAVGSDLVLSLDDNNKLFLNSAMSFDADTDRRNKMHSGRLTHRSDRFPYSV